MASPETRYRLVHWGRSGENPEPRRVWVPDATDGPLIEMGELVAVTYRTRKGLDSRPVLYNHDFGPRVRPVLAFNASGLFVVSEGRPSYEVTPRGIVG